MRRMLLLVIVLVLCNVVLVAANGNIIARKSKSAIDMLPPAEHHLEMIYKETLQKFLFRDDIFINKKDIGTQKKGAFAIDSHMSIESLEINGRTRSIYEVMYYSPKDIQGVRPFRLTQVIRDCKLYEFYYDADDVKGDTVAVTLRYSFYPMQEFGFGKITDHGFVLDGDYLWFPNSLQDTLNVNLSVITPKHYNVQISGCDVNEEDAQYLKTYRTVIRDNFRPITIVGERVRLK